MDVDAILAVGGDGYWATISQSQDVRITRIELGRGVQFDDERICGHMKVYIDETTWNCERDGHIYTDRTFLSALSEYLDGLGLPGSNVGYSEAGMQGSDYVDFDVGTKFYVAWMTKFGISKSDLVDEEC